jgi:membrane protein DedA with SNARE-associated domain
MEEKTSPAVAGSNPLFWLKKRLLPIAGLLVTFAIVVAVFLIYRNDPAIFDRLKGYGYAGSFVISVILNGTIIFPVSNMALMVAIGITVPQPWAVGLLGGLGAGIGELTGYVAGRSGRGILSRSKTFNRVEGWVKKWGWLAVFVLSIIPFAFDVVGIIAGALRMPVWRFFLACMMGRIIIYTLLIYLASYGFKVLPWL